MKGRIVRTLYIGGGTPTCLSPAQLRETLAIAGCFLAPERATEFTVEANPNSLTDNALDALLEQGVNRLSIGIQSMDDGLLRTLGRAHTAKEAADAVGRARRSGFRNIGIDLIYGIPGQDRHAWNDTLARAVELGPGHISAYALSIERGTVFARRAESGALELPDEDAVAEWYECACERLAEAGYRQYELSNFARPGFECVHNLNYWERGEYAGLGPGAWSYRSGRRSCTISDLGQYSRRLEAGALPIAEEEYPTPDEAAREYLLLRLRTAPGLDLGAYRKLFGEGAYVRIMGNLEAASHTQLFETRGDLVLLTKRGKLLADPAIAMLCP